MARGTAYRLSTDVRPTDVDLEVRTDPARSGRFSGKVTHHLELTKRRRSLELHATDLRVTRPLLVVDGARRRGRVVPHAERETVEIQFDEPVPAGSAELQLGFSARLRRDLRGLYQARSGDDCYAFTQLEAADARRFFPCFDEPAFKARFRLSVTTAKEHTVLSNNPVDKVELLPDGQKTVHFERTPLLSTYLLALAVGELECSEPTHCGRTEIRVWHVPGKGALTAFALEAARETLTRLEGYFDLPYPYEKLDLVAVPDFEAGAMENAGAVFFRETLLLLDPDTATLNERKRAAEVICHELAHMWYGDLVTMAWWNDLWLNEAFATWMAFQVVDAWKPEWRMWQGFQHFRAAALGLDALSNTHPIYTPVRDPYEATENFDLITYEKGASVVRMIERYLGPEAFRSGVRTYIRRHRESNAEAADLWEALSEASGQDVEAVVRSWIEQPGFPLLEIRRKPGNGRTTLVMRQERFTASPPKPRRKGAARKPSPRWPIPWVGTIGVSGSRTLTERALVRKRRDEVVLQAKAPRFVYGNAEEAGFFRPLHEAEELERLAKHMDALAPVERMGLLGHQWAHVRAGRAKLGSFLLLADACGEETDPEVLTTLGGPLGFIDQELAEAAGEDAPDAFRAWIGERFGPQLEQLGWEPAAGEPDETRLRRAALLSLLGGVAEWEPVVSEAAERARAYLLDRSSLEANLADVTAHIAARLGDASLYEDYLQAAVESGPPQERRRFLMALGDFREPELVERTLAALLGDRVSTQDVALLLYRLLENPAARERAWEFWKGKWTRLSKRMPPMLASRPVEALPALQTRAFRRDVARFFRKHPIPTATRAVKQTLERFDLNAELRERAAPELARWLEAPGR